MSKSAMTAQSAEGKAVVPFETPPKLLSVVGAGVVGQLRYDQLHCFEQNGPPVLPSAHLKFGAIGAGGGQHVEPPTLLGLFVAAPRRVVVVVFSELATSYETRKLTNTATCCKPFMLRDTRPQQVLWGC